MKINYIIIPLITIIVSILGSMVTASGMDWYKGLNLPEFTPPGSVIGAVWTVIFILTALSALIVWNKTQKDKRLKQIAGLFVLNGVLNFTWSYLFFGIHLMGLAVLEAGLLTLSVLVLMILIRPRSKTAAVLLYPYFMWTGFATYLTYSVWMLNI